MQTQIPPAEDRWDYYLFRFHLILANKESRPPRRGSWRPWERRSGHRSWCSPAAAGLFSGSALEAAAGHLQIWTSELPPGEAVSVFRKCKPGEAPLRFQCGSPAPTPPHIPSHGPFTRGTEMWQHAIMGTEIIAHCHVCFDTGCYLGFSQKALFVSSLVTAQSWSMSRGIVLGKRVYISEMSRWQLTSWNTQGKRNPLRLLQTHP